MNQQLKRQLYFNKVNEYKNRVYKIRICIISAFVHFSKNISESKKR